MRITLDLEDIFTENEEQSIEDAIKDSLVAQAVQEVRKSISQTVNEAIVSQTKSIIDSKVPEIVGQIMADWLDCQEVNVGSAYDKKLIPLREYIKVKYIDTYKIDNALNSAIKSQCDSAFSDAKKAVEKVGKDMINECNSFVTDLRARYDMVFATQIVNRMREEGLLKDEAIAKLLETKTGE